MPNPIRAEFFAFPDSDALRRAGTNPPAPGWAVNSRVLPALPMGYQGTPSRGVDQLTLDTTDFPPGSPSGRSCRIHWPNRADPAFIPPGGINTTPTPGLCHDYTISPGDVTYGDQIEVWVEHQVKMGPTFAVEVPLGNYPNTPPGTKCTVSGSGCKFFFPGLVKNPNSGRWGAYVGVNSFRVDWPIGQDIAGGSWMGNNTNPLIPNFNPFSHRNRWLAFQYHLRNHRVLSLPDPSYLFETGACQLGSTLTTIVLKPGGGQGIITYAVGGYANSTFVLLQYGNGKLWGARVASIVGAGGPRPTITLTRPTSIAPTTAPIPGPGAPDTGTTYHLSRKPLVGDGIFKVQVFNMETGALVCPPWGFTDLITAGDSTRGPLNNSQQVCHAAAIARNMNQGPVHDGMMRWDGGVIVWAPSPGWGL